MKKTRFIMLSIFLLMCGIGFAAPKNPEVAKVPDVLSVASNTYKVKITETATDGRDVSVAGPFYMATYTDDNGGGSFDYYGNANVGNNAVVELSTSDYSGMTVVQIVIISKTLTYEVGTSAGNYTIPITSDATITIFYQLGSGKN